MKKIYFLIIIGIALVQSGCQNVLDTKPLDKFTGDQVWGDAKMAQGYMFSLYSNISAGMYTTWREETLTKNAQNQVWGGDYIDVKTEQIERAYNAGWGNYGNIRSCNLAIEKLTASNFVESEKNILLGEAHFLRAMTNFHMAKRFGGIQIIEKVLTPDGDMYIPRATAKDSYDFVLKDLADATNLLPLTNERGRATKGAAYALTMRVAIQAGAYLNDNAYYQTVLTAGDKLFALPDYSLENSYSNLFNNYSTAIVSKENILVVERLEINSNYMDTPMQSLVDNSDNVLSKLTPEALQRHPLAESLEGWCNFAPTQDLVDDYLVTDADGKEKVWNQTSYLTTKATVKEKIYTNRDLRFYASIVYDESPYFKNTAFTRKHGNVSSPSIGGGNAYGTTTGYWYRKGIYESKKLWYSDPTPYCFSILRLGEAYLNYAEAALMRNDEAKAREYMSKTYNAHGGFTNSITATGTDLWTAYKRERNVEMTLESGDRYWSLLRWGMQKTGGIVNASYANSGYIIPELVGKMHAIEIDENGINYNIVEISEKGGQNLNFTPRRYLFPVPYNQTQQNSKLTQNPGWNQ
jgi:hypothetical protein